MALKVQDALLKTEFTFGEIGVGLTFERARSYSIARSAQVRHGSLVLDSFRPPPVSEADVEE